MLENVVIKGDCLSEMKVIPDGFVETIITDPPYGIDFQSQWKKDKAAWKPKIANDKTPFVEWTNEAFRVLKDGCGLLCFTRWDTETIFRKALSDSGFVCKQQLIWDKGVHGMGDLTGDFASQHENIIFATKGRFVFKGKRPTSIFRTQRVSPQSFVHPNEKPIELLERLIEAISIKGEIVFDPFAGSGTTAMACIHTNRRYILIEKEEKYIDIINKRIADEEAKTGLFPK